MSSGCCAASAKKGEAMDYGSLGYDLVKVAHIVSLVAWMAGMLYLPRLFVYHADAERGSALSETFKVMERRLLKGIVNPAMGATWFFGLVLAWSGGFFTAPWLHAKLAFVILLSALHGYFSRTVKDFAADGNRRSAKFYRILNEVPTVLLILIVLLVVLKPF
jgi:putative membrane protein